MAAQSRSTPPRPKLLQFAAINTFREFPSVRREWTLDRKLAAIKAGGFIGVVSRAPPITREALQAHGLRLWATADIVEASEIVPSFTNLKQIGAEKINVQMADHDTPTRSALALARRVMRVARALELDVAIEFHRDTATETPEKMFALADAYAKAEGERLNITWDFSHFGVIKHLSAPFYERIMERPDLVLPTDVFHFRPFNGHHAQIPVIDARGRRTPEYRDWLEFTDGLIEAWLREAPPGREMWTCPEMIPGGYGLSVDPPLFEQAVTIRRDVQRIWNRRVRDWRPPQRSGAAAASR